MSTTQQRSDQQSPLSQLEEDRQGYTSRWPYWTGLGRYEKISDETDTTAPLKKQIRTVKYVPGKTLWDWMQLLLIPLMLAAVTFGFSMAQQRNDQNLQQSQFAASQQLQTSQFAASQQLQTRQFDENQRVALDQQRQTLLTNYLDHMAGLMPALSRRDDAARLTAQAQTLAVLLQLNPERKRIVVQYLYQANLINVKQNTSETFSTNPTSTILRLNSGDLSGVDLSGLDLHGISLLGQVNLRGAKLNGTLLYEANLYQVNLSGANLSGANLNGSFFDSAILSGANLTDAAAQADFSNANLSSADLSGANLKGANLDKANLSRTNLTGARYNTQEVDKTVNGVIYKLPPTIWPDGFDPTAAGAIEDNSPDPGP